MVERIIKTIEGLGDKITSALSDYKIEESEIQKLVSRLLELSYELSTELNSIERDSSQTVRIARALQCQSKMLRQVCDLQRKISSAQKGKSLFYPKVSIQNRYGGRDESNSN